MLIFKKINFPGNFKEICKLLSKNNLEFNKMYSSPTNYTSHLMQDEF